MKQFSLGVLLAALLSGAIACQQSPSTDESSSSSSTGLPGEGITVKPIQINAPEDYFQIEIIKIALEKLGYEVAEPEEVTPGIMYVALANGDVDYTASAWERAHTKMYENIGGDEKLEKVGVLVANTVQGYQIDKKTAEEYNITHLDQLKDPEIAKLFDSDRNGKANLAGCPVGWGCESVIEHHLDAYGLRETVDHDQGGGYGLIIANSITRHKQEKPILIYTWIPLWVEGVFTPGENTVWLEVPYTSLPEEQGEISEKDTTYKGKNLGVALDRVRITANKKFITANPAAKNLFESIAIPIEDISAQNWQMREGEDQPEDITRHAEEWIAENQDTFDGWIEEALQVESEN